MYQKASIYMLTILLMALFFLIADMKNSFGDDREDQCISPRNPQWSYDGSQILFTFRCGDNTDIWKISTNGDNPTNLTNSGQVSEYIGALHPNSNLVIYYTDYTCNPLLYLECGDISILDTTTLRTINITNQTMSATETTNRYRNPSWSPSGTNVAFVSDSTLASDILLSNIDNPLNLVNLTEGYDGIVYLPRWSPDGSRIAFTSPIPEQTGIWIIDIKSGAMSHILDYSITAFDWSPTGNAIVFSAQDITGFAIYVAYITDNSLVSEVIKITTESFRFPDVPKWSPNGRYIAFTNSNDNQRDIWILNVENQEFTNITSSKDADDFSPVWSPSGEEMAFATTQNSKGSVNIFNILSSDTRNLTESIGPSEG